MIKYFSLTILVTLLITIGSPIYSQDLIYKPNPNLDYVAVNNEIREGEEEGFLKVIDGDNVKISGYGNPNTSIYILYENKSIESSVDTNGNWFAIFTVLGLPKGNYPVYLQFGNSGDRQPLITLVVTEREETKVDDQKKEENIRQESTNSYIGYLVMGLLIPIFTAIGWFLGSYSEKNKDRKL